MAQKITTVTVQIPYKRSGGIISQQPVTFDLYRDGGNYSLTPCLSEDERRVANLPEALKFVMEGGKPVSLRGKLDGNFHVIQDVVAHLQGTNQLV